MTPLESRVLALAERKVKCPNCTGDGKDRYGDPCFTCHGSGMVLDKRFERLRTACALCADANPWDERRVYCINDACDGRGWMPNASIAALLECVAGLSVGDTSSLLIDLEDGHGIYDLLGNGPDRMAELLVGGLEKLE